jgi:aspartokinase
MRESEHKQIDPATPIAETAFEKRRGIRHVEIRSGYAQVHINQLKEPIADTRLDILQAVGNAEISVDFLKFTPTGVSFMVQDAVAEKTTRILENFGASFSLAANRHIVTVHAVNMRDEQGLIADVMAHAIRSGAKLEHITDMHDRMLIVVAAEESERLKSSLLELAQGKNGN